MMELELVNFSLFKDKEKKETLLSDCSCRLASGSLFVIQGESGMGKTSLLNALSGISHNTEGEILLNHQTISGDKNLFRQQVSYMTSDGSFIREFTVEDELCLVKASKKERDGYIQKLGLSSLLHQKLSRCSEGEQARTAVCLTLLKQADLYLFDEPTANLDQKNKEIVLALLKEKAKSSLVILVTHDFQGEDKDVNLLTIENKNLVFLRHAEEQSMTAPALPEEAKRKVPHHLYPKLAGKKALEHPIFFALSFLFSLSFLFLSFFTARLSSLDQKDVLSQALLELDCPYYRVSSLPETVPDEESLKVTQAKLEGKNLSNLNIALLEELSPEWQKEALPYFQDAEKETPHQYPIVLTVEQKEYLEKHKVSYHIGSPLPLSFEENGFAVGHTEHHDQFILRGFVDFHGDTPIEDYQPYKGYPAIIRKKDYLAVLENSGIRSQTVNTALCQTLLSFREFSRLRSLPCEVPPESQLALSINTILPYSRFKESVTIEVGEKEEKDVALPSSSILLPYYERSVKQFLNLAFSADEKNESYQPFFTSMKKDNKLFLPLEDDFQQLEVSHPSLEVYGGFSYVGENRNFNLNDVVLVSDDLYQELLDALASGKKDYLKEPLFLVAKSYLVRNTGYFLAHPEDLHSARWQGSIAGCANLTRTESFLWVFLVILGVFSLLIDLIYILMLKGNFFKIFAVFTLLGKNKATSRLTFLLSYSFSLVLGYLVSLILSYPLSELLLDKLFKVNQLSLDVPKTGLLLAFLFSFLALLLLELCSFLISLLPRKKKAVDEIKEDE